MKVKIIKFITLILFLFTISGLQAQITVLSPNGWTPQVFLENVLVLPPQISGVYITNGTFNNSAAALPNTTNAKIGRFTNGPNFTDFPISSGIIMTTGGILAALGPNNSGGNSVVINDGTTDTNLQALTTYPVTNLSKLEFDFVSISGDVQFEYIFASEEYPEYVCSSYNDVFGFFLTGLHPVTGDLATWNIALIPGSTLPVTINSLNPGVPGSSSGGGTCSAPNQSLAYSSFYYSVPSGSAGMQYDGFTVIPANNPNAQNFQRSGLLAKTRVAKCTPYHMKLAIGNVSDMAWDSGVFIKEGSFMAPTVESNHNYTLHGNDTLLKACNSDTVIFSLSRRDPSRGYVFTISNNSIPNPGLVLNQDYEIFYLNSITNEFLQMTTTEANFYIPRDSLFTKMIIRVPETAVFAPGEVKTLRLQIRLETCSFESPRIDTLTYYLRDNSPIIILDQVINTCDPLTSIEAVETGGGYIENVTWDPPTYLDDPHSFQTNCDIADSIVYTVIAYDNIACRRDTATITVNYTQTPIASFTADKTSGCAPLNVRFTSTTTPEYATYMFIITNPEGTVNDTLYDETFVYTFQDPGYYNVTYYAKTAEGAGCDDWLVNENFIFVSAYPVADFTFFPPEPTNGRPIDFTDESTGDNIVSYYWNFGDGSVSTSENPTHSYHITSDETFNVLFRVTNQYNCAHDTIKQITVVDKYAFYVPNSFTPNNDGVNDVFLPRVTDVLKYHLMIYNRNGQCIFQSIDPEEPWDGTYNGTKCPAGTYTWMIEYLKYAEPETELRKTGSVMLVR